MAGRGAAVLDRTWRWRPDAVGRGAGAGERDTELTRILRNTVLEAGIGAVLTQAGLRLGWLRRGLRGMGVETVAGARPPEVPRLSRMGGGLLTLGWAGSLAGLGMVWTGVFGG